jgi:Ca2+-binding RTX toxin-like protein
MRAKTVKVTVTAIGAAMAAAVLAAPASAAVVNISNGNRVVVTGEGSERNVTSVYYDSVADLYTVLDTAGASATAPCTAVNSTTVTCPGAAIAALTVRTGAGADSIAISSSVPATTECSCDGGTSDDALFGGRADDSLSGSSNEDLLVGGPGSDELRGGGGRDTAYYADQNSGVTVTIGSGANDGNANDQSGISRDNVLGDVEIVTGSVFGDSITGDGSDESFFAGEGFDFVDGGRGRDTINGGGGDDDLAGNAGSDEVRGEAGNDDLSGGADGDRLIGGTENDFLSGGEGVDAMTGKAGIDRIFAKDGTRDRRIKCGDGANSQERVKRDKKRDPKPRSC